MNCKHCKSKETRKSRIQPNGNIQYQCKKCKKYFTIEQEKKETKKQLETHQIDRRGEAFDLMDIIVSLWLENQDLKSRLDHADKVNLANVKFMQDIRAENHKLSMQVQYRNVAICLLVALLAIVSGLFFY